jgi:molecular chaperone GrpE
VTVSDETETRTANDATDELDPEVEASPLEQLEDLKSALATMLDDLQRSRAEFANYRRRMEQDQAQMRARATEGLLKKLLPVADDFDRALRAAPDDIRAHPWHEGIRLVERKLWSVLENEGVRPIEAVGAPFDPSRHEAIMVDEDAAKADTVIEEFQRGYTQHDTVLRPSMVKVGAAPESVDLQA